MKKLIAHPALVRKSAAAEARAAGVAGVAESNAALPEKTTSTTREKARSEGEANASCLTCVTTGKPVNPVSGSKILAGASEFDFALPAPLPLVWPTTWARRTR